MSSKVYSVETKFSTSRSTGSEVVVDTRTHTHIHTETADWFQKLGFSLENRVKNRTYPTRVLQFCHIVQGGARNVVPLIVHITRFYFYKSILHLVQN